MNFFYALVLSLSSILLLTGCQDTSKDPGSSSATISKPLQTKIQRSSPVSKPSISLSGQKKTKSTAESLGITVDDGKIIIDTRQTRDFLRDIGEKMNNSFNRIEASLKKEKIQSPNETGIIITDTKLQIDLNKTRNFMEKWMRSMESVVNELNKTMSDIKRSFPKK